MAITKVWIEEGCVTCGIAEGICPEVFKLMHELGTNTVLPVANLSVLEDKIREAADACYAGVIKFSED